MSCLIAECGWLVKEAGMLLPVSGPLAHILRQDDVLTALCVHLDFVSATESEELLWLYRLKREEDRIQREMAEREEEEARAVLEQAAKTGKIKIPLGGEKLDKQAILTQVRSLNICSPPLTQ